jgi:hypothetical protein
MLPFHNRCLRATLLARKHATTGSCIPLINRCVPRIVQFGSFSARRAHKNRFTKTSRIEDCAFTYEGHSVCTHSAQTRVGLFHRQSVISAGSVSEAAAKNAVGFIRYNDFVRNHPAAQPRYSSLGRLRISIQVRCRLIIVAHILRCAIGLRGAKHSTCRSFCAVKLAPGVHSCRAQCPSAPQPVSTLQRFNVQRQ